TMRAGVPAVSRPRWGIIAAPEERWMRNVVFTLLVAGAVLSFAAGQASVDSKLQGQLKQVFPGASGFSLKGGSPPHFTAFSDPGRHCRSFHVPADARRQSSGPCASGAVVGFSCRRRSGSKLGAGRQRSSRRHGVVRCVCHAGPRELFQKERAVEIRNTGGLG